MLLNLIFFQLYLDEDKLILNEMMMRSAIYRSVNMLSRIFIVLAH
jgi:hypothetical protein